MAKYIPGQEPADIRKKLDLYFPKIEAAYPDKQIRGMYKEHKKWLERASELRKMLGYENNREFFAAYGFTMIDGNVEQKLDLNVVIEELKKRYKDNPFVGTTGDLKAANPDISGNIQTLVNRSSKEFGMPATAYLISIGVLDSKKAGKNKRKGVEDNPIEELNNFIKQWEKQGCKQYKSVDELFKECEYIDSRASFYNWVKAAYGISGKDYLEIAGVLDIKISHEPVVKEKKEKADKKETKVITEKLLPTTPETLFQYFNFTYKKRYNRYEDDILKNKFSVLAKENDEQFQISYVPYRFDFINDVKKEQGFFEPNSRADVISYGRASYNYESEPELIPIDSNVGYAKLAKFINAVLKICTEENLVKLLPLIPRKKNGTFKVNRVTPVIWNEMAMGENCYALIIRAIDDNAAEVKVERNDCDHSAMRKLGEVKFSLDNYATELLGE